MYEKLDHCPACGHTLFTNEIICQDYAATQESFALVKCAKCTLIFTNPRPDIDHIGKYYQHDNYISHTNKANNLTNFLYKLVRNYTLNEKIKLIKRYSKEKRILDFGCGAGLFADKLYKSHFNVVGYEPSAEVDLTYLSKEITIHKNINQLKKENNFDLITAWHVLEHVHELQETIKTLKKLLNQKGIFIIAVPNIKSHDAQHYEEHWAAYDVPRHLYHFNQQSINSLMEKNKFKQIGIHPMKFDAFYVSLLSEQYKNTPSKYINAIRAGLKSNEKAKTTNEYSSLIYVYQKQ